MKDQVTNITKSDKPSGKVTSLISKHSDHCVCVSVPLATRAFCCMGLQNKIPFLFSPQVFVI